MPTNKALYQDQSARVEECPPDWRSPYHNNSIFIYPCSHQFRYVIVSVCVFPGGNPGEYFTVGQAFSSADVV